jgi:hypothetical protein
MVRQVVYIVDCLWDIKEIGEIGKIGKIEENGEIKRLSQLKLPD